MIFNGIPITVINDSQLWVESREDATKLCPVSQPTYFRNPWDSERECWVVPERKTTEYARRHYLCPDCDSWTDCIEFCDASGRCFNCYDENNLLWAKMWNRAPSSVLHRAIGHLIDAFDPERDEACESAIWILQRAVIDIRIGWTEPRVA